MPPSTIQTRGIAMSPRTTRPAPASVTQPRPSTCGAGWIRPASYCWRSWSPYTAIGEAPSSGPDRADCPSSWQPPMGRRVSLEASLAEGDTLLYSRWSGLQRLFPMQIPELSRRSWRSGEWCSPDHESCTARRRREASCRITRRFSSTPTAGVADAYGMLGVYGHSDRPSHSFALVRQDSSVGWVRHYAEMFVPPASSWPSWTPAWAPERRDLSSARLGGHPPQARCQVRQALAAEWVP
jgi:hypothetical protein